ncbi:LLM class flavin-dependent oxidoreductase [Natronolimnohabitans innermongolicus]|uniref:Luciferase family oxidoreductase, group 1 n=1 Tax=Natronolimnohabitans innermongolicus JCM 12255 TaxID=1227499 RepID=L9WXA0_9EURY|nr:LLM class flavin-dependent oxidoreductase [Natronolimnohabitans innermongolicus]ELY54022.1 luciferase family oxidoreductase, group 1 [Natronolimnohabitans innermongolicus JCM 12255]
MDLSIVDLAPVPEGGSATEAFEHTVERAQRAEELGYSRFWVAEHHDFTDSVASTTPEALIPYVAAETDAIRVGSGTVLLNHYSPYKVAETFGVLDALEPGRIDLGLGRATGNPASDLALQDDRSERRRTGTDHAEKIEEVVKYFHGGFADDHPFADLEITRSAESVPEIWVLGSSPASAKVAGELGLPYCFAAFIRPEPAVQAFETYRDHFESSPHGAGPDEPTGMLSMNVTCAETDEEAARLRATTEASSRLLRSGRIDRLPVRSVEEAIDFLGGVPEPTRLPIEPGEWPRAISGSPETVRELLEELTDQLAVDVDEVVVQSQIADPDDTLRSHELLAEGVGLSPR